MLHTTHRSGAGRKTSTTTGERHQCASLAAISFWTAGRGLYTGAGPADSQHPWERERIRRRSADPRNGRHNAQAIYGSGCMKHSFSSSAGAPTPDGEVFTTSFAKHTAQHGRMFGGIQRGGTTVAAGNQFRKVVRQRGHLTCHTPDSKGDLRQNSGARGRKRRGALRGDLRVGD